MFREVGSKVNFVQLEEDILRFWREQSIFDKSISIGEKGPHYTFYEGPPTANGSPGIHHVLARLYKDTVCRYKTMKGYHVPRKAGWDTHGLPVELEVEKSLALASKVQIEEYGVARFNDHCRQSAFKYIKEWEAMTERLGYWLDMAHPYITLDNSYIESCWWIVKELWDKGLVYQGYKVTPHCPRCGTSLSSHEVALGYRDDAEDPSVYIKFQFAADSIKEGTGLHSVFSRSRMSIKSAFLLAWTTTPWTLSGNTALAVAPDADYAVVDVDNGYLILANTLVDKIGLGQYKVVETVKGSDLTGLHYEPLYKIPIAYSKGDKPAYRIIGGDFVSMEEGTGIVHIAPAYGEIDFEVGEKEGLPLVNTVDLDGLVKTSVPTGLTPNKRLEILEGVTPFVGFGPQKLNLPGRGKFVKDADKDILDDLKSRGLLFRSERITHTYPFCWRCDTPLLYYAKPAWYIRTTALKNELISGNTEINWYPDYIKRGRFGDWLENNVDWAFSRERYWGTPLNIWCCQACGTAEFPTHECVGGMDELRTKPGLDGLADQVDLHRPHVDEITFACARCGGRMRRVPDVIDCWFDSGAMPVAQWHYPFENKDKFRRNFPADFICEAVDQTRGWFYSLHAISTLLFNGPCFRNVICLGHVVDAQGEKMSKSKGNVIDPWTVINNYGADALRWYMLVSTPGEDNHRFSTKMLEETMRKFLFTLWNTYSFFTLYANVDHFVPQPAMTQNMQRKTFTEMDHWIISELNRLVREVTDSMDRYNLTSATRRIEEFVDNLSNWYVRRNRRRFWKSESDADKLAAYTTLYRCLVTLSQLLAPFVPFIAEELYRNLFRSVDPKARESVHLSDFPVADEAEINDKLNSDVELAMKISSLGRAARAKAGIKVRQPLAKAVIRVETDGEKKSLEKLATEVMEEINVKQLVVLSKGGEREEFSSNTPNYTMANDARYWVAIATELHPELVAEGVSRELVRHLQNMRRNARFDITDRIITYYQTGEPLISQVIRTFANYIKQETLSEELIDSLSPGETYGEKHHIANGDVCLAIKKADPKS
ncbi:MAG: isoleucine--tRNA ligase [Dehalococcoidia bacterium]|nr:isoleucine--tRNA ligase [Dehalococcoidia bacterium]